MDAVCTVSVWVIICEYSVHFCVTRRKYWQKNSRCWLVLSNVCHCCLFKWVFAPVDQADPFGALFFFSFHWVGVESPCDISPATVVVTPFYSSPAVMTVIVSKITQFLHFLNVMSLRHTVSVFCNFEPTLCFTFNLKVFWYICYCHSISTCLEL